ncbi:probable manganese-transporting ATPase PDR2 [Tanacetum coccineum]
MITHLSTTTITLPPILFTTSSSAVHRSSNSDHSAIQFTTPPSVVVQIPITPPSSSPLCRPPSFKFQSLRHPRHHFASHLKRMAVVRTEEQFYAFVKVFNCPIRGDSAAVLLELKQSSHDLVMITDDQALTAFHVAREVNIISQLALILVCLDDKIGVLIKAKYGDEFYFSANVGRDDKTVARVEIKTQVQVQQQVERQVQEHMRQRELEANAYEEAREREWQQMMDDINSMLRKFNDPRPPQ